LLDASATLTGPEWVSAPSVRTRLLDRAATALQDLGRLDEARDVTNELLRLSQTLSSADRLYALKTAVMQCYLDRDYEGALQAVVEGEQLSLQVGDRHEWLILQNNAADIEMRLGRRSEAAKRLAGAVAEMLATSDPAYLAYFAETLAVAIGPDEPLLAAHLYGAAAAVRESEGLDRSATEIAEDEANVAPIRALLPDGGWNRGLSAGTRMDLRTLMAEVSNRARS
jgi:tetratricopeptide (TPR) repeat protein